MIEIIKNGKDKTFSCRCQFCASDLNYNLEDVQKEYSDVMQDICFNHIKRPVCGTKVYVYLMTDEDYKDAMSKPIAYVPGYGLTK